MKQKSSPCEYLSVDLTFQFLLFQTLVFKNKINTTYIENLFFNMKNNHQQKDGLLFFLHFQKCVHITTTLKVINQVSTRKHYKVADFCIKLDG